MSKKFEEAYARLCHAIQTGLAYMQSSSSPAFKSIFEPKHLRVGIDLRALENAAIVGLLVEKGVFTVEEFQSALLTEMAKEVAASEKKISDVLGGGTKITLV